MPSDASDLPVVEFGEFRIDFHLRAAYQGPEKVKIGPVAFNALEFLVRNRERVVSKAELLKHVWGGERTTGTVEQAVSQLRRIFGDDALQARYIETVPGHGYHFIGALRAPPLTTGTDVGPNPFAYCGDACERPTISAGEAIEPAHAELSLALDHSMGAGQY